MQAPATIIRRRCGTGAAALASSSPQTARTLRPRACTSRCCRPLSTPHIKRQQPRAQCRSYYSSSIASPPPPYPAAETAILSAAIERVPQLGFTDDALAKGAVDAGYLPASTNLFTRGPFELALYHVITQRLALKDRVQFPAPSSAHEATSATAGSTRISTTDKIRTLLLSRLHANGPLVHQLPGAFALMAFPGNIPASLAELSRLVDEIWYLAGDVSVDSSWYTKRATLAGVYASSEVFMTQDKSENFRDTEDFLDRRLEDAVETGKALSAAGQWLGFTGMSTVNVLRSFGVRI